MNLRKFFTSSQLLKWCLLLVISFSGAICFAPPKGIICNTCHKEPCICEQTSSPQQLSAPIEQSLIPENQAHYIYISIAVLFVLIITTLVLYRKKSIAKSRITFGEK